MALFESDLLQLGYALNKMCFTLNTAGNRATFLADEDAYCQRFGLTDAEVDAIKRRDRRALMTLGGNMYFLAKLDRCPRKSS